MVLSVISGHEKHVELGVPDDFIGDAAEVVLDGPAAEVGALVPDIDEVNILLISPCHQCVPNNVAGLLAGVALEDLHLDFFVAVEFL